MLPSRRVRILFLLSSSLILASSYYWLRPVLERSLVEAAPQIEALLSKQIRAEVSFGKIQAQFQGLQPELMIEDLLIRGRGAEQPFSLKRSAILVDLIPLLKGDRIRIKEVRLEAPLIHLRERRPNYWVVEGLEFLRDSHSSRTNSVSVEKKIRFKLQDLSLRISPFVGAVTFLDFKRVHLEVRSVSEENVYALLFSTQGVNAKNSSLWDSPLNLKEVGGRGKFDRRNGFIHLDRYYLEMSRDRLGGELNYSFDQDRWEGRVEGKRISFAELEKLIPKETIQNTLLRPGIRPHAETLVNNGKLQFRYDSSGFSIKKGQIKFSKVGFFLVKNWPEFSNLDGEVRFASDRIEFDIESGTWRDLKIGQVHGETPFRKGPENWEVKGLFEGDQSSVRDLVEHSPYRDQKKNWSNRIEFRNQIHGAFRFTQQKKKNLEIKLSQFEGRELDSGLSFNKGSALLNVRSNELLLKNVRVNLLGGEQNFSGRIFKKENELEGTIKYELDLDLSQLGAIDRDKKYLDRLGGRIKTSGSLEIAKSRAQGKLDLSETLVHLPDPFRSERSEFVQIDYDLHWKETKIRSLKLDWMRKENGNHKIRILFDSNQSLQISGQASQFDARGWFDLMSKFSRDQSTPSRVNQIDMDVYLKRAFWNQFELTNAKISLFGNPKKIRAKIRSFEVSGQGSFDIEKNNLAIRLKKVLLPEYKELKKRWIGKKLKESDESRFGEWDWPSIQFEANQFRLGAQNFGKIEWIAKRADDRLDIQKLKVSGPELHFELSRGYSTKERTNVQGSLKILKSIFPMRTEKLQAVELEDSWIELNLDWPGQLQQWSLAEASGKIKGYSRSGRLIGVESSAADLFNFLSYADDDSKQKQTRFWKASFDIELNSGKIISRYQKYLFGSVFVKLTGLADAKKKIYKMEARVTPMVEDIADPDKPSKQDDPGNLLSHTYRIDGTWDKPSVGLKIF